MRSVALDLGAKKIAYCEVSGETVIDRKMVDSLPSLEPMLGPSAKPARVAIEACREAWFVHATLTAWGNEVLLVDTTRSRRLGIGHPRGKNDRIDAEVMARAFVFELGGSLEEQLPADFVEVSPGVPSHWHASPGLRALTVALASPYPTAVATRVTKASMSAPS
jgi:hypothetical protein